MGLDLTMYRRKDFEGVNDNTLNWSTEMELAYGRKTWAIEHWFETRSYAVPDTEYVFDVPEATWDEFYKVFSPYRDELEELLTLYRNENEKDEPSEAEADYYNRIDNILNKLFGEGEQYQLGSDWEANVVVAWIDAYSNIKQVYAAGEQVYMSASF